MMCALITTIDVSNCSLVNVKPLFSCFPTGHFVISVVTRNHCNHYLIETIESMFYVRRDRSEDRGRDIQACDLRNLIQCYRTTPLDESGMYHIISILLDFLHFFLKSQRMEKACLSIIFLLKKLYLL